MVVVGVTSDSFAYLWHPFPPTELLYPVLIWWYMPGLIVACYAVFS